MQKLYLGRQAESENTNREIFDIFHAKLNNIIFLLLYIIIVLYPKCNIPNESNIDKYFSRIL